MKFGELNVEFLADKNNVKTGNFLIKNFFWAENFFVFFPVRKLLLDLKLLNPDDKYVYHIHNEFFSMKMLCFILNNFFSMILNLLNIRRSD